MTPDAISQGILDFGESPAKSLLLTMLAAIVAVLVPLEGWCGIQHQVGQFKSGSITLNNTNSPKTEVEQWALEQISQGNEVRLPGMCRDWRTPDEKLSEISDPSLYTLSGKFVAGILNAQPFSEFVARPSIKIFGARIVGDIVLEGGATHVPIVIECSTVEGNITFQDWRFLEGLEISKVRVTGLLKIYDFEARSLVALTESDINRVEILRSKFSRDLSFRRSNIRRELKIVSTDVSGSLLMGCYYSDPEHWRCATYGRTVFLNVDVLNGLDMIGSQFVDDVSFQEINFGGSVLARNVDFLKGMTVRGGEVKGEFQLFGSTVRGPIDIRGIIVQGGMNLNDGEFSDVSIIRTNIKRYITFNSSKLRLLNLEGTIVQGELNMGTQNKVIKWNNSKGDAQFIARNTRVESLHDSADSWLDFLSLELDGFEYDRLSGFTDSGESAYLRGAQWFKDWLERDKTYSPQPYTHLNKVLRREGQKVTAAEILYTAKEIERKALASFDVNRLWLEFLRLSIGYGLGLKAFRVFVWIMLFVILGWFVAMCATRKRDVSSWTLFWYSVSYTLPGLAELKGEVSVSQRATRWFCFQRLICSALASLAAVAAAGLVQP